MVLRSSTPKGEEQRMDAAGRDRELPRSPLQVPPFVVCLVFALR